MPKQVPKIEIHDEQARIVKGWGTVDVFDKANERLPIEEFKRIMPIIMKRGGIVMNRHTNQPAGKILNYNFLMKDTPEGPKEGVFLETEVYKDFGSDDEIWDGIKKGEIEGFSFGGRNNLEDVEFSKGISKKTLKGLEGFEFSYVPKGCNQEATIEEINYIAKEDVRKEEGETSTDSDHYHLYKIDDAGDGKTLGTLPREADEHTHKIESGIVVLENGHDHTLIRELIERVAKTYDNKKKTKSEKDDDTDDKTLSKSDSTLTSEDKKDESFIKNSDVTKNMAEDEDKKPEVQKVEEAPQAADVQAPSDPMAEVNSKLDQLISLLSVQKADDKDKPEDKEEDEEKVEKEGDGEKVKLPESEGDEVSQQPPAQGDKTDEAGANFLTKDDAKEIAKEAASAVMKGLNNPAADTPRVASKTGAIIKADEGIGLAKNWAEANKMIKKAGFQ